MCVIVRPDVLIRFLDLSDRCQQLGRLLPVIKRIETGTRAVTWHLLAENALRTSRLEEVRDVVMFNFCKKRAPIHWREKIMWDARDAEMCRKGDK